MLVAAVLLAAGNGERLGRGPKALVPLTGRPLLSWALDALAGNDSVRQVGSSSIRTSGSGWSGLSPGLRSPAGAS